MKSEELIEIYVRCAGCGITKKLSNAVMDDWKFCQICSMIFCSDCAAKILHNALCLGSKYTKPHKAKFDLLPVEEILSFGEDLQRGAKEGKYISKFFYTNKTKIFIQKRKKPIVSPEEAMIIRYRQEQWKKFGTVLVKRKDGKFITWGQIE